ncbi:MAG: hypothetical protein U0470_02900 [Anaerolineae bacterium]
MDGSGAAAGQATVPRAKIAQLGSATRDAVGHIVLVDLTSDGRLFFPLANGAPDAPFVTAFLGASTGRSIDQVVGMALAAFDAPISICGRTSSRRAG